MWEKKQEFLEMMRNHQVIVLEGHTGSGKTTQVPQFVIEAGLHNNKKVISPLPHHNSNTHAVVVVGCVHSASEGRSNQCCTESGGGDGV